MAAKHFIIRRIVLPIITVAIIVSQLAGCAIMPKNELLEQLYDGDEVAIELVDPNWTPVSSVQLADLSWVQLDKLEVYTSSGFRGNVDTALNISTITTPDGNTKNGCMYVVNKDGEDVQSGNTSLRDAFRNKQFATYWEDSSIRNKLANTVDTAYTDVESTDGYAMQAVLNAYYNLFNDGDNDSTYGGEQSLTREQFMTLLFKAGNEVKTLDNYTNFKNATGGDSYFTRYAAQMEEHSYLKTANGSLSGTNIATPISKLEAIYMVVDTYLKSEVDKVINTENIDAFGYKDAGDQVKELKLDGEDMSKAVENNLIAYLVDTQGEEGIDHTLMAYMKVAEQNGLTDGIEIEDELFDSISKDESIRLIVNTFLAENNLYGYLTNAEYGSADLVEGNGIQETESTEETDEAEDIVEEAPEVVEEAPEEVELFSSVSETVYATTTVNVRDTYSASGNQLGSLSTSQSVTRTGIGTGAAEGWSRIEFNGAEAYVKSDYLSTTKPVTSTPSSGNSGSSTTTKPSGGSSTTTTPSTPSTPSGGSSTTQTPPPTSSTADDNILGDFGSDLEDWANSQDGGGSYEDYQNSYVPIITQP